MITFLPSIVCRSLSDPSRRRQRPRKVWAPDSALGSFQFPVEASWPSRVLPLLPSSEPFRGARCGPRASDGLATACGRCISSAYFCDMYRRAWGSCRDTPLLIFSRTAWHGISLPFPPSSGPLLGLFRPSLSPSVSSLRTCRLASEKLWPMRPSCWALGKQSEASDESKRRRHKKGVPLRGPTGPPPFFAAF